MRNHYSNTSYLLLPTSYSTKHRGYALNDGQILDIKIVE
jgi:hypothetical protein